MNEDDEYPVGYGLVDNIVVSIMLNSMLDGEDQKAYMEELEKEDKEAYREYLKRREIMEELAG